MLKKTFGLALVALMFTSVSLAQESDFRLQLFSSPESRVVAVGDDFEVVVEGLAITESDSHADELITAFRSMAFPGSVNDAFEVRRADPPRAGRRARTNVYQLSKRFTLRPLSTGVLEIPELSVSVGGQNYSTQRQVIRTYTRSQALMEASNSVLPIVAELTVDRGKFRRAGSAFLIAEDALVTAYHVIVDADRIRISLPNGRTITTRKVWAIDPIRDVAILHINPDDVSRAGIEPLTLSDEFNRVPRNDGHGVVFTAGWRDDLQILSAGARFHSLRLSTGDVLRVSTNGVRPGDSGGALLNEHGDVLGVVSSGRGWTPDPDVLSAELCLAADPRRALADRAAMDEPVSLRSALRQAAGTAPNAEVLQVASLMTVSRRFREDPSTGFEIVRNAMSTAPNDASLQFLAGSVLQELGEDEMATSAYQAALNGLADYFPALYALGHIHYNRGELDRAEELFHQTRAFEPYDQLGSMGLARIYVARAQYDLAEAMLLDVLEHDAQYAPATFLLGYIYIAKGRTDESEALAIRLDHIDPGWADALRVQLRSPIIGPPTLQPVPRVSVATAVPISR